MSDLLDAAAEALGTPAELIRRSAEARATANGTTADEVLASWASGAPAVSAAPAPAQSTAIATPTSEATPPEPSESQPAADAVPVIPVAPPTAPSSPITTPSPPLEPVAVRERIRTATRVGTWAGAILGLVAFVVAASTWSETASVTGDDPFTPILISDSSNLLIGVALVSIVFGAVVASLSRAAASWANPAMQLSSSRASTAWIGGSLGLVLGTMAGAILGSGFGTPIEGSEGLVQLPVISTLLVMVIGGAVLGALTTLATQFFAVPVTVDEDDTAEISAVKRRLGGAIGIPLAGVAMLLLLVLPFAFTLIASNHLTSGGAAIVAVLTAAGVLGFAALAGSKPNMRISFGEFLVALAGIGAIILLVFAILNNTGGGQENHEGSANPGQAIISLSRTDLPSPVPPG